MSRIGQWCAGVAVLLAGGLVLSAQEPAAQSKPNPNAIEAAVTELGAADLRTIRYSGTGFIHVSGQRLLTPGSGDRIPLKRYEASIDYPASAMAVELVREGNAQGDGAATDRHIQAVNGATAWDVAFAPAPDVALTRTSASTRSVSARARAEESTLGDGVPGLVPQPPQLAPDAALERRYAIWVTPHGFLKAALANQPALRPAGAGTEVSFYSGAQRFIGFVNSKNQVERVRIWIKRPSGDLLIDTTYTDYATFGKASFPTRIVQTQTGQPTLELSITAVQPNAAVRVPVPETLSASKR
jgi:hypothetical protein